MASSPHREPPPLGRGSLPLALALLCLLLAGDARATASTYSTQPGGSKVLYLLLQDLGYRTARVFDLEELDAGTEVLVLLGPPDGRLGRKLLAWVKSGKKLILIPPLFQEDGFCGDFSFGSLTIARQQHFTAAKAKKSGPAKKAGPAEKPEPAAKAGPAEKPEPAAKAGPAATPGQAAKAGPAATPGQAATPTRHSELTIRESVCTMTLPATATLLAGSKRQALAFEHPAGAGWMLVLAHEEMVVNGSLDWDDTAVLIRRWLDQRVSARAKISFLEGRQGGQLLDLIKRANLSGLVLHGLAFLLLLYWSLFPRFGDPRPVLHTTRRAFAQHARALGNIYQHRGASGVLLRHQYERFRSRILGRGGLTGPRRGLPAGPAARDGDQAGRQKRAALAALISTRTGRDADSVESVLAQVEYSISAHEVAEPKEVQRHFRLSQSLAALQHSTVQRPAGKRGPRRG